MKSLARIGLIIFVCNASPEAAVDVPKSRVTEANFALAEAWTVEKQLDRTKDLWTIPHWLPQEDRFWYRHGTRKEVRYLLVEPASGSRSELFDRQKLASLLGASLGSNVDWRQLRLDDLQVAGAGDRIEFSMGEEHFIYELPEGALRRIEAAGESDTVAARTYSPDGEWFAFVRDCNIFVSRTATPEDSAIQVTSDGESDYCATSEVQWSPDSGQFAIVREDSREVEDLWLVDSLANPRPKLVTYKWPMPGETVEQYSLWIYDLGRGELVRVEAERWPDQTVMEPQWRPDSKSLYFLRMSRDWLSLDLCLVDPKTGKSTVLIEERGYPQIYTRLPYHVLSGTGELLWWSMRSGWGHYTLHDASGTQRSQVTSGAFHSGACIYIDESERVLYFMGNGRERGSNPYYHHLYRVNLDGSALSLLTPEAAEHEISMAESGKYFLDNYSRPDLAPRAVIRDSDGEIVLTLEDADIGALEESGWRMPEVFKAKAADGRTDLWGVLFAPFDMDPERKYPIVVYGYPGKESEFIPWKFYHNSWITMVSVSLAQYGFVVAVYGNRGGSPERSLEYYDFGRDNLRDYPIADKKAVVQELARRYSFIDLDRVGVMGASSGGFFAATAILLEPDFFKVAVAKSGNHDNNVYYHHWNERYGDVRQEYGENGQVRFLSRTPTNLEIAKNLKGHLLLIQGDMDLHVPPSQTARLADALIKANKRFDQLIVPGGDHFFGRNWQYLIRVQELYFVEHLLGDSRWTVDIFADPSSH